MGKDETEGLIKIFVTSIKTAVRQAQGRMAQVESLKAEGLSTG